MACLIHLPHAAPVWLSSRTHVSSFRGLAPHREGGSYGNLVSTGGIFVFFDMVFGVFALRALKCAPLVILFVGIAAAYDVSRAVPKPRGEEAISRQVQIIRGA
jgi:hypothetical protein